MAASDLPDSGLNGIHMLRTSKSFLSPVLASLLVVLLVSDCDLSLCCPGSMTKPLQARRIQKVFEVGVDRFTDC